MYSLHRSYRRAHLPPPQVLTCAHPSRAAIRLIQISTEQTAKSAYVRSRPCATVPSASAEFLSSIVARKSNCVLAWHQALSHCGPERVPPPGEERGVPPLPY